MRSAFRFCIGFGFVLLAAYVSTRPYLDCVLEPSVARAFGSIGTTFLIWYWIDRSLRNQK
jgi:hypothetical protein